MPCLLHMIPCPEWCDWCSKFWSPQEGNKVIVVFNGPLVGGSAKTQKCNKLFLALFPQDPLNFWEYDGWGSSSKFPLLAIFWRAASPTFFSGWLVEKKKMVGGVINLQLPPTRLRLSQQWLYSGHLKTKWLWITQKWMETTNLQLLEKIHRKPSVPYIQRHRCTLFKINQCIIFKIM